MYAERTNGARNQLRRMPGPPAEIYRMMPTAAGARRSDHNSISRVGGWREDTAFEMLRSA